MTFGTLIRELTDLCNIKRCNLAAALGYDPSYVSRWVNDTKLPTLSGNDRLLKNIAAYIVNSASPEARTKLIARFTLPCSPDQDSALIYELEQLLSDCYRAGKPRKERKSMTDSRENATLSRAQFSGPFPETIFHAIGVLDRSERQVDMICTTPIHGRFKNNESFFRRIRSSFSPDTSIRVIQFVDMEDISEHVDLSCRSFCYLMGRPHNIRYEFYELKPGSIRSGYTYLIRNAVMMQYIREPISKELYLLESTNPALIAQYCSAADDYILNRTPMTADADMSALFRKQYFLDYFMQPRCRCLLKHMHPLFFPEALQEKLLQREQQIGQNIGLFLDGSRFFESMILYKSALVDYVYTGRMMVFGHTVIVPKAARMQHLQNLKDKLMQSDTDRLFIVSTDNRICGYDDLPTSMFISRNAAFALQHRDGQDRVLYTVNSNRMIAHFNHWLDHIEALPQDQCLHGQDAIDYIDRCIRLI